MTIREVVIKIRTEAEKAKAPDMAPAVEATKKAYAEMKGAADVFARAAEAGVANSVAKQMAAMRELVNVLPKESAERKLVQAAITEAIIAREREAAAIRETAEAARRSALSEELNKMDAASIRAGAALKSMGESSMLAVRGFAMLSASGDKDLQRILHHLLMVQGALDVFKGAGGIILGVARAWEALEAAAKGAAAAQVLAAGAGVAGGARGVTGGLGAGLGGAAIGAGTTAAATGTGTSLLSALGITGGGIAGAGIGASMGLLAGIPAALFGAGAAARYGLQRAGVVGDYGWTGRKPTADLQRSSMEQSSARDQADLARSGGMQRFGARETAENERLSLEAARGRLSAAGQIAAYEKQVADARMQVAAIEASRGKGSSGGFLGAQKEALALQLESENNLHQALVRQTQLRETQLQKQREAVQVARDALQAEKDKNATIYAGLGALNPGEQEEVKRINAKVGRGEKLDPFELHFLQGKGGGAFDPFVSGQFQDRGKEAFGNGAGISNLTGGLNLTGRGSQEESLNKRLVELLSGSASGAVSGLEKMITAVTEAKRKEAAQLDKAVEAFKKVQVAADAIDRLAAVAEATSRRLARLEAFNRDN